MSPARPSSRRLRAVRERPTLGAAAAAFLAQPDLAASSRRSYAQTLGRLQTALGEGRLLDRIGGRELERAVWEAWGQTAPATWNRHVATLRSFASFGARHGWLEAGLADGLARRREPADRTRAIPYPQLEQLWRRDDVAVREKALWRLLYETAARAQEVLSLDVDDVDLDNRRARVRSKGGDTDWLHLQTGSARLLPRLVAGRARGPVFLADRRPAPTRTPATADLCPYTGRARCLTAARRRSSARRRAGGRSSAAPLGAHPPRRGRRVAAVADGQVPASVAAVAAALRPARTRGGGRHDRRPRSRTAPAVSA